MATNIKAFLSNTIVRVVLIIVVLVIIGLLTLWAYKTPFFNFHKVFDTYKLDNTTKHILIWSEKSEDGNSFFGDKTNYVFDEQYFKDHNCPKVNCLITTDKSLQSVDQFDAIIFYGNRKLTIAPLPEKRNISQKYVFATQDSLNHLSTEVNTFGNIFNWTMSYRTDSDIVWHHKGIIDNEINLTIAPATKPVWREVKTPYTNANLLNTITYKSGFAAAYYTDCDLSLKRNQLIDALRKFIKIDVYGNCGEFKCEVKEDCFGEIEKKYKFFLAFEDELCTDYVTDQFYEFLNRTILPVVYGGADYTKFAPNTSYINANQFKTVPELAERLTYLDHHPDEYVQYFWWKQDYTVRNMMNTSLCNLCKKLHDWSPESKTEVYSDVTTWFNSCTNKSIVN